MGRWQGIKMYYLGDYFYEVEGDAEVPPYMFPHNYNYRKIGYLESPSQIFDFTGYIDPGRHSTNSYVKQAPS